MGSAITSPGASALNAMRPGPRATIMCTGSPASMRLNPPRIDSCVIAVSGSFQSSTWWPK